MLNEERVKLMVKLASYEEKEGKEDFKVSSYYKKIMQALTDGAALYGQRLDM